jgi:hypothetical protein
VDGVDLNPLVVANNRTVNGASEGFFGPNGIPVAPTSNGILGTIDQTAAADLSIGLGNNGHLGIGYLVLDQNGTDTSGGKTHDNLVGSGLANRDSVLGADADYGFGRFKVSGGYHVSDLTANTTAVESHHNASWDAKVKYGSDRFGLWGGYREVDNNYYAPGDWGRLGIIQNPGNIKGWQAGAHLDISKSLRLSGSGEWDKGESTLAQSSALDSSPFDTDTNIRQLMARLDLRINPNLSLYGSWQDTAFSTLDTNFAGASHANYDWTTIGLGYGLSSNAKFNLAYQFSNAGTDGIDPVTNQPGRWIGGILTSQLTIKF